jgi:hypothetical protein
MNNFVVKFAGGGQTHISPLGMVFLTAAIILILVSPRKYIIVPFLMVGLFLPGSEEIVIGSLHFFTFRILLIFAWMRVLAGRRSDQDKFHMNPIDKAFLYYALSSAIIFSILWMDLDAVINRLGFLYSALGVYFLLRLLQHSEEDVDRTVKVLAIICSAFAVCMLIEQQTGRNFFSVFGGVAEFTLIRDGRLRSQASFENAISAGIFGAALLPVFVGLWWKKGSAKLFSIVGIIATTTMTFTSASATPIMAYLAGLLALGLWLLRKHMRLIRWGIVSMLLGLQLVMKANVWSLIERVNVVGGNSGFHRYVLVDGFIRHFFEWCLIGVKSTASWGYFTFDEANMYVYVGANGGLITFVLFIAIIVYCFKGIGKAVQKVQDNPQNQKFIWAFGAALFAHMVAFFGLSYFDQTLISLYVLFAMIASTTTQAWAPVPVRQLVEPICRLSLHRMPVRSPRPALKSADLRGSKPPFLGKPRTSSGNN